MKASIIYWSSTGNTETMANAIADAAKAAGADITLAAVSEASADDVLASDIIVLGCPAMGSEELDDSEMEPFFSSIEGRLAGKKVALFGSYDWGDGEWMRIWYDRAKAAGADMIQSEGLIAHLDPDSDALAQCSELGKKLA